MAIVGQIILFKFVRLLIFSIWLLLNFPNRLDNIRTNKFVACRISLTIKSAVRNRVYTGKTHAGGFQTFDFYLVRAGGLYLCSRDF